MQFIVGDIHGCAETLRKLLAQVRASDANAKFVFVGDYVDRGLRNKEVIDIMLDEQKKGAVCLRGNHDDIVDFILHDECFTPVRDMVYGQPTAQNVVRWWAQNGLDPTLMSYGVDPSQDVINILDDFRENVPQDHKTFFRTLPVFWDNETHFCCHARWPLDEDLPDFRFVKRDRMAECLWDRFDMAKLTKTQHIWDRIGVFGHTPTTYYGSPTPIKYGQARLIDTCVFRNNYLTAYCCETDDWILQATVSTDIEE